jgi:hypothetical protein
MSSGPTTIEPATNLNSQPSPTMKPTIASAKIWIARKALLQARQKRFLRAAATLHWPQFVVIASAFWVLNSVMSQGPFQIWLRVGYVVIAVLYMWTDIHYSVQDLKRRYKWATRVRMARERAAASEALLKKEER